MHFDGSKLLHGSGAGVTLKSPKGDELSYVLQIHFPTTNNIAEYEALLHGLCVAKEIGVQHIMCCGDSDLVAQQVAGTYKARNKVMAAYRDVVDEMPKSFLDYDIKHVRREDNMAADTLSKLASTRKAVPPGVFLEHLHVPSVKMVDPENLELASSPVMAVLPSNPPWAEPYLEYLTNKKLKAYTIIDGQLYKRSTSGVFMKCISQVDGIEILREIHEGECGHHAAARSLVAKAFRHGFYWPTSKADADQIVKLCQGCQMYSKQTHMPATTLHTIPITWPFAVWGLDMVDPLKIAPSGFKHLLVAVDKFMKWEAKPIRKLHGKTGLKFVKDTVFRFGIPHSIITDNGTNLSQGEVEEYCHHNGIRLDLASVAHPQSNGQVERTNGLIMSGIKPRLEAPLHRAARAWAKELPSMLWSLQTMRNTSTGLTPFFLVYGAEAILPIDVKYDSPRVEAYKEEDAEMSRQLSVDLLEEERDLAAQRSAIYQQNLRRYHSCRVRKCSFKEGDLVVRLKQQKSHKLSPSWEGPFVISKALLNSSYYLVDVHELDNRPSKQRKQRDPNDIYDETDYPWNIALLHPFYT
jgi:ribonuclease HI